MRRGEATGRTRLLATGALVVAVILCTLSRGAGAGSGAHPDHGRSTVQPTARVETEPVPHAGDAADDPALWIHPEDPALSLLLGTDKDGGVHVYDLNGSDRGVVGDGAKPNNVDILYGFDLEGGKVDLAFASLRSRSARGVKIWSIDATRRSLTDVTEDGVIPMESYGVCGYHSARTGRSYIFATERSGKVAQWELKQRGHGTIGATKVRTVAVANDATEGCVADNDLGFLYVAAEKHGIWKTDAEPEGDTRGRWIARVGRDGLTADVEGLAIYYAAGGRGYLLASSQGSDTFMVFERDGDNRYVRTIDPAPGAIDDVNDTDGIDVTSVPTTLRFPRGVFVVQDGTNPGGNQNFKLYAWEDIAGNDLLVDTAWSPRALAGRERSGRVGAR